MTFGQLKGAVARLGFESDLDDVSLLCSALSRALYMLYRDRPVIRVVKLSKTPFPGRLLSEKFTHTPKKHEYFTFRGQALSFSVSGKGRYTLRTGGVSRTEDFDTDLSSIRQRLGDNASITFEGDYGYTVYGLCDIDAIRSDRLEDIPLWDERSFIDLKRVCKDYMSPHKAPTDIRGRNITGAVISDGILTLPEGFFGEVLLTYKRAPSMPGGLDDNEPLDLPEELTELLPLAVASFVWLDDDAEKAQYYLSLYKDGINTLRRFHPREAGSAYHTDGWA